LQETIDRGWEILAKARALTEKVDRVLGMK